MKKWSKSLGLLVTVVLLFATACSGGSSSGGSSTSTPSTSTPSTSTPSTSTPSTSTPSTSTPSTSTPSDSSGSSDTSEPQPVTLRFSTWFGPGDIPIWEEVIQKFQQEYPYITIEFEPIEWDGYWQRIPTQMASNTAPDILGMAIGVVFGYMDKEQLEPLDAYLDNSDKFGERVPDFLLTEGKFLSGDGLQYALPWRFVGAPLFVNLTAFQEAGIAYPENGWTFDEFRDAARKLTTGDRFGFRLPGNQLNAGWYRLFGTTRLSPDRTQSNLGTPEMVEYYTWQRDMALNEKTAINPLDVQSNIDPFAAGQVGMAVMGSWMLSTYREITDFEWDVAPMPSRNGVTATYAAPDMISINKGSPHKEEAWKFIEYAVYHPDAQKLLQQVGLPMLESSLDDQELIKSVAASKPAHFEVFLRQAGETGVGFDPVAQVVEMDRLQADAVFKILTDPNTDVSAELQNLQAEFTKILSE